ncbi:hypothetical protein BZM27_13885 [Paraburkholderia steynii]|uniref:Uncharacterized protein n=3 Tax=Paraburkholderia TaxID=1822464 RepID=A0A7Z7FIP6_9BURK|nr:hypothetical protein C2L65_08010 [Paraburkholderia terrae]TCG08206.1 hypothetical protein BZM27_13885 [Paraburkholderia steynii]SDI33388.1 hypothetical protein SAMN04487926_11581 [Paraburkholderia steynii]
MPLYLGLYKGIHSPAQIIPYSTVDANRNTSNAKCFAFSALPVHSQDAKPVGESRSALFNGPWIELD